MSGRQPLHPVRTEVASCWSRASELPREPPHLLTPPLVSCVWSVSDLSPAHLRQVYAGDGQLPVLTSAQSCCAFVRGPGVAPSAPSHLVFCCFLSSQAGIQYDPNPGHLCHRFSLSIQRGVSESLIISSPAPLFNNSYKPKSHLSAEMFIYHWGPSHPEATEEGCQTAPSQVCRL